MPARPGRRKRSSAAAVALTQESMMPDSPTHILARFAATLDYERIPEGAREHCKNLLLDTLACAIAGHQGEETQQVANFAAALARSDESSIIAGDRLSL